MRAVLALYHHHLTPAKLTLVILYWSFPPVSLASFAAALDLLPSLHTGAEAKHAKPTRSCCLLVAYNTTAWLERKRSLSATAYLVSEATFPSKLFTSSQISPHHIYKSHQEQ